MQRHVLLLLALAACGTPTLAAAGANTNPLAEVLSLLGSLAAKIVNEGEEEAKAFKAFVEWCDDATANVGFQVKTAGARKDKLEAAIGKAAGDAEASSAKVEELAASVAEDEADLKSATAIREKEASEFAASEAELVDVVSTLARAISLIERELAKNPAAFAQMDISSIGALVKSLSTIAEAAAFTAADKQKLVALVQSQQAAQDDDEELDTPLAAAYKSHSGGILGVLEDLKDKAEEQLSELRKAESNARREYETLKQSLEDQIAADSKDMDEEKAAKAATEEAKATAEGELTETVRDLANGKHSLETAKSDCIQAAADHEATVRARAEELRVLAEARKILEETASSGASLLQLRSRRGGARLRTSADLAKLEVLTLVKRLAREHHSAALTQLAARIADILRFGTASGEDPFAKVKGLVSELIAKLEAEAGLEASEKAYCDGQMSKTESQNGELEYDLSKLTAQIDQATSKSVSLKADVRELESELAALTKQQAWMDRIRQESHADYVEAKAQLEQGLAGVRRALGVLRRYYGTGAASMLQGSGRLGDMMQQPAVPVAHTKATGAGSNIVAILEVLESDLATDLAAKEAQEDDAATDYEKLTQGSKATKALKEQDIKYKTAASKGLDKALADLAADRDSADAELSAVLDFLDKIKKRCIAQPETYAERARRREAEIAGLKEAFSILEDEAAFAQRGRRALRGRLRR